MKKILFIILAFVLVFSLVACDDGKVEITNAKIEGNTLTWDCNKDGTEFAVKIMKDGNQVAIRYLSVKSLNLDSLGLGNGTYTAKVAQKDAENFVDANGSFEVKKIENLSLNGSILTWSYSATATYTVEISKASTVVETKTVASATTYDLSALGLNAGEYSIKVSVQNDTGVTAGTATYNVGLSISSASITDGVASWTANGTGNFTVFAYDTTLDKLIKSVDVTSVTYSLSGMQLGNGVYTIKVGVKGSSSSLVSAGTYNVTTSVTYVISSSTRNGDTLTWVSNASTFYVKAYSGATLEQSSAKLSVKTFDLTTLGLLAGTYTIKIEMGEAAGEHTVSGSYVVTTSPVSSGAAVTRASIDGETLTLSWECTDANQTFVIEFQNPCGENGIFTVKNALSASLSNFDCFHDDYHYWISIKTQGSTAAPVIRYYYGSHHSKGANIGGCSDCQMIAEY